MINPYDTPFPPSKYDVRMRLIPKRGKKGFETLADIASEKKARIRSLQANKNPRAHELAKRLSACRSGERCTSLACPHFMARARVWLIGEMLRLWANTPWEEMKFITLVSEEWIVPADALSAVNPKRICDQVRQQFHRAGIEGMVIGSLHGEYDKVRRYWQPHLHLVASGLTPAAITKLRRHYPGTDRVYRSMVVQEMNAAVRQFSYALKSYWPMKVRYTNQSGGPATRRYRIVAPYHPDQLVWLDQFGLQDILLLMGVRRHGDELRPVGAVIEKGG